MQTVTTEVEIRDPSAVALTSDGNTVIAPNSGATTQTLVSGRAETSESSNAAYEVTARREPDASIWLEWTTALPLVNGERNKVLGAEPLVFQKPLAEVFSKTALDAPSFVLPMCATIAYRGYRYSRWSSDTHAVGSGCNGSAVVPYQLETPWSNVVIHEKTRVQHGSGWMLLALSVLSFVPFAVIMDTTSPKNVTGGQPTQVAFTVGIVALTLGFGGAMIPTIVTPDRDVYVRR